MTLRFTWTPGGRCRHIHWLHFSIVVSQGMGRPPERVRDAGQWGSQNAHPIHQLSSPHMGVVPGALKPLSEWHQRPLTTGHHNRYSQHENVWKLARVTKMWQRQEGSKCSWEHGTHRLYQSRVATDLCLVKRALDAKWIKTRSACTPVLGIKNNF